MGEPQSDLPADYAALLVQIKGRIQRAQVKAHLAANAELVLLYWDIGRLIHERQTRKGWGAKIIPQLSAGIRTAMPGMKGFSERNIGRMVAFYREYEDEPPLLNPRVHRGSEDDHSAILPPVAAKLDKPFKHSELQQLVAQTPWSHQVVLLERVRERKYRIWYMRQMLIQGWSRRTMEKMARGNAHLRQGAGVDNFEKRLPSKQSELARKTLKDPYVFDFLTVSEPYREKEMELALIKHLECFLVELGRGFSFVGRQHRMKVAGQEFFLDLLFYHLELRCFLVIELKKGAFKPEYAGKVNFYCSVVDDQVKLASDQPTIGLILCEENNRVLAEYSLRGIHKPIGVSEYELTASLPESFKSSLPSIAEIEAELNRENGR